MTRWSSAIRASVPPSPLLSARMIKSTYFSVTTTISAHSISDMTPSTISRVSAPPAAAAVRLSLSA